MWNAPHLADMDLIDAEGNDAQAYDPRECKYVGLTKATILCPLHDVDHTAEVDESATAAYGEYRSNA